MASETLSCRIKKKECNFASNCLFTRSGKSCDIIGVSTRPGMICKIQVCWNRGSRGYFDRSFNPISTRARGTDYDLQITFTPPHLDFETFLHSAIYMQSTCNLHEELHDFLINNCQRLPCNTKMVNVWQKLKWNKTIITVLWYFFMSLFKNFSWCRVNDRFWMVGQYKII